MRNIVQERSLEEGYTRPTEERIRVQQDIESGARSVVLRDYGNGVKVELCTLFGVIEPFPSHFHDYYMVGVVAGGNRRLTVGGRDFDLMCGDLLVINPGDPHSCESADGTKLEYRSFSIAAPVMDALLADFGVSYDAARGPLFPEPIMRDPGLFALALDCHVQGCEDGDECGRASNAEPFYLFFERLLAESSARRDELGSAAAVPDSEAVAAVCRFIEQGYRSKMTLDDMADAGGMGRYALIRAFTREKGITPYRYLLTLRIIEARSLLAAGAGPAEVAAKLGFADQAHFGRTFKEVTGVSPGAYRASRFLGGK